MQKYLPVLRNCPFFTRLTDDEILSILHCVSAAKITRPRGSYLFRAGDSTEVMGPIDFSIRCPQTVSPGSSPPARMRWHKKSGRPFLKLSAEGMF